MESQLTKLKPFTQDSNIPEVDIEIEELNENITKLAASILGLEEKLKPVLKIPIGEAKEYGVGMKGQAGGEFGPAPLTEKLRDLNHTTCNLRLLINRIKNRTAV